MAHLSPTSNLGRVSCTIVELLESVPVLKYNKLLYLFEYFYIKSFGVRYTHEEFVKIDNGPVVNGYKDQLCLLAEAKFVALNIKELLRDKKRSEFRTSNPVKKTRKTNQNLVKEKHAFRFIGKFLERFGDRSGGELIDIAYRTRPMVEYKQKYSDNGMPVLAGEIVPNSALNVQSNRLVAQWADQGQYDEEIKKADDEEWEYLKGLYKPEH